MSWRTPTILVVSTIAIVSATTSLMIRHRANGKLRAKEELLSRQKAEWTVLLAEHRRLSNLVVKANSSRPGPGTAEAHSAELVKLRSEAEALRRQTNELAKELAENRRARPLPNVRMPNARGPGHSGHVVSDSDSEEYKEQLYRIGAASPHFGPFNIDARNDAQNLGAAVRRYALEHEGEVPASFAPAAPYLFKEYRTPNAGEYEIVYHGSLNELTNIPQQAVALIRERQAWPTPAGKLGRIYVMANGFVKIVESDDNFEAWESEHIIPAGR